MKQETNEKIMSSPVNTQPPYQKISKSWYLLPILFIWLGGIIGYFYWRNKNNGFAKRLLIIGIILMFVYLVVLSVPVVYFSDTSKDDNETNAKGSSINLETESFVETRELSSIQKEIMRTEENLKINRDYQKDIWSLLSTSFFSDEVKSKDQVLFERIESLERSLPSESEELQYLHMDLKDVKTPSGEKELQSRIKYYENMIRDMKKELNDLKNKGIVALEEYELQELKEGERKYMEKIHRLETLQTKNLDYLNTDEELIQHISNYKGLDGKGNTLLTELKTYVKDEYYDEVREKRPSFVAEYGLEEFDVSGYTSSSLFGTEYVGSQDMERYGFVRYGFFPNIPIYWTTTFEFTFDKETYDIAGVQDRAILVLERLN